MKQSTAGVVTLDDPFLIVVGPDDDFRLNDLETLDKHYSFGDPIPPNPTSPEVTVDIANPKFDVIEKSLFFLGRKVRPVHESGRELVKLIYKSDVIEERRFKRNPAFVGGERGLFAKAAIVKGQPLLVEKGLTFILKGGPNLLASAVLLDKTLAEKLSRRKRYGFTQCPYDCFDQDEWNEAMGRAMVALVGIGHAMEGEIAERGGLLPILGTLNHSCTPNACYAFDENEIAYVFALRDIEPGEEITVQYGLINGHEREFGEVLDDDEEDYDTLDLMWTCGCGIAISTRSTAYSRGVAFAKQCIARYRSDLLAGAL